MAINSAPHSTIAQYPHHIQTNPFLLDPKYPETIPYTNPFEEKNVSGLYQKVKLAAPPAIPPPPTRSRRASTAFQNCDGYLDPRNSALNQRRSSSPFQNYSGIIENDLSKSYSQTSQNNSLVNSPYTSHSQINSLHNSQKQLNANDNLDDVKDADNRKDSLTPMPTIILPNNYHEFQKQTLLSKENSQKNKICQFKMTHNTFTNEPPNGCKSPNSQKPLFNHSTTESSESGIGSEKNGVNGYKSPPNGKVSVRQDSNVSSDSMSQTSSPSYTTKTMETPLLLHHIRKVGPPRDRAFRFRSARRKRTPLFPDGQQAKPVRHDQRGGAERGEQRRADQKHVHAGELADLRQVHRIEHDSPAQGT